MKFYTLKEAAEKSGYSAAHLQRLAKAGKVACSRRARFYFFTEEQLAALMPSAVPPVVAPAAPEVKQPEVKPETPASSAPF